MKLETVQFQTRFASLMLAIIFWLSSWPLAAQDFAANQPASVPTPNLPRSDTLTLGTDAALENSSESPVRAEAISDESLGNLLANHAQALTSSQSSAGASLNLAVTMALLSLVPVVLLMTTCYVRIFIVFSLLRQAIGGQQLPSNQLVTTLSFCITLLVMAPVWKQVQIEAWTPAQRSDGTIDWRYLVEHSGPPIKRFMLNQIIATGNETAIQTFWKYQHRTSDSEIVLPENLETLPLSTVLPAFLVSELKVAFLLGFQLFLPFLILDLVVATLTVSLGMVMLPPTMISLPLKLVLFVMADGWNLVVGLILQSVAI